MMEPDALHLIALSIFGTCMLWIGYLWGSHGLARARARYLMMMNHESPPPPASAEVETERRDREQAGPAARDYLNERYDRRIPWTEELELAELIANRTPPHVWPHNETEAENALITLNKMEAEYRRIKELVYVAVRIPRLPCATPLLKPTRAKTKRKK